MSQIGVPEKIVEIPDPMPNVDPVEPNHVPDYIPEDWPENEPQKKEEPATT